jgi:signal transduction histidine kinase
MDRVQRRTIRRLVVGHIVAFGMITLATGAGAYLVARHMQVRKLDANMSVRMATAEQTWRTEGLAGLDNWLDELSERGGHFAYILATPGGRELRTVDGVQVKGEGWGFASFNDEDDFVVDPARTLTKRLPDGSMLTIVADRDFIEQFDAVVLGFLAFSVPLLLGTALIGSLSLESSVRRRLYDVNSTAEAIIEGDLSQRVPITGNRDEFDLLSATFNRMLDRIGALLGEVRRVTAYVAHDLRTPLVGLAGDLRAGRDLNLDVEQCRATLGRAADSADRLIELFGMILEIGEITSVRVRESGRLIDLTDLVENLAETHVSVAEDSGRTLSCSVQPGIYVFGVGDLLAQALINLIQNALTHTPPGTRIHIALDASDSIARLTVTDNGPGLPEADRRQILADDRLSQSAGGSKRAAIGLRLINAIATAHHGTLRIEDAEPGLRAVIELPLGQLDYARPRSSASADGVSGRA